MFFLLARFFFRPFAPSVLSLLLLPLFSFLFSSLFLLPYLYKTSAPTTSRDRFFYTSAHSWCSQKMLL